MKKLIYWSTVLVIALLFTNGLSAQRWFDVHTNLSIPVGDFGDDDAGGAGIGANGGLKLNYLINEDGVGAFGAVDFFINGTSRDVQEDLEDMFDEAFGVQADYDFPEFRNIPFSAGLQFYIDTHEGVEILLNGGLTANYLSVSNFEIEIEGDVLEMRTEPAFHLGFKAGAELLIAKKISLQVGYFGLGDHELNITTSAPGIPDEQAESDMKVSILTVGFGYHFR